ncbi:hypothetical protein AVEN_199802-1 [Araneus ventricosus]|uniref:Uncharacterized protein n=1 Tax=Araneus ventricosus TaxID=182803 RepID=A0A4Y2JC63_ARAVE|nr:hypothetical protein AVEN_199802-1 [Araneus ventricosus]
MKETAIESKHALETASALSSVQTEKVITDGHFYGASQYVRHSEGPYLFQCSRIANSRHGCQDSTLGEEAEKSGFLCPSPPYTECGDPYA